MEHAKRELALVETGPEGDVALRDSLIKAVEGFCTYEGHSGGSHSVALEWLTRVLNFQNLTPLTDDPDEWMHVGGDIWPPDGIWQNRRCSEAFSNDGGKTYHLLSEGATDKRREPLHRSAPANKN